MDHDDDDDDGVMKKNFCVFISYAKFFEAVIILGLDKFGILAVGRWGLNTMKF